MPDDEEEKPPADPAAASEAAGVLTDDSDDDPLFGEDAEWDDAGDASSSESEEDTDTQPQPQPQPHLQPEPEPEPEPGRVIPKATTSDCVAARRAAVKTIARDPRVPVIPRKPVGVVTRAAGERSDSVALGDPTGSLNIAEIRPVAKQALRRESLVDALNLDQPPEILARNLVAPLDGAILRNVLSKEECNALISSTDVMGYSFWADDERRRDFRSADTVEVESIALASAIWDRILPHITQLCKVDVTENQARWEREIDGAWTAYGVNYDLLFGRYGEGGHFSPHTDGNTVTDFNNRSLYSMIIYLNDCPDGGSTRMLVLEEGDSYATDAGGRFRGREENVVDSCPVEAGSVLLFYQNIVHEGEPVGPECSKYIIRTDLMFKRDTPSCDSDVDKEAFRMMKEAEEIENAQQGPNGAMKAAELFRKAFRISPQLAAVYGS